MDTKDKPSIEQLQHFYRLLGDKYTSANFQAYLNKPNSLITSSFTHDKTKDNWTLVNNVTEPTEINIKKLEAVSFLESGESYVNGEEMVRRAKDMLANLGQQHAEYLLAHQNEIPKEFRKHCLVFSGTVWQDPGGRDVPCLCWGGDRWYLCFSWLEGDWGGGGRLLRASS